MQVGDTRMVSITLRNVTKRFGEVVALQGLNLEIRKGELFFLLGPSGCGKTTLLRTLAGFYLPDEGTLHFGDEDVTRRPPHRRNTAMVFQSYALWPHMNVAQNVSFGLQQKRLPSGVIEGRVNRALRLVQMEGYGTRKINQLSGGQQQRVALARALVVEPACLLLDEPLSNLDAQLRLEMRAEIRRICKEAGLTTVYVTHDQKEALSIADRMAVLEGGDFRQVGTPQEVYRNPRSRSVAQFIGESNFLNGRLIEPAKRLGYWSVETNGGTFEGRITDSSWTPKYNDRVTLSIRPECFSLVAQKPFLNYVQGRIVRQAYLGELAQYWIEAEGMSTSVQLSMLNPRQLEEPGDKVYYAEARPEDVVILNT
jgi:iron(III) transport system ATP-binding protein